MKTILNFILTIVVFYIGSHYFPEHIYIEDTKTLILTSVLRFAFGMLIGWLFVLSMLLIPIGIGCVTTAIMIVAIPFMTAIILWTIDYFVIGFAIHGVWTYVLLTVIFGIFSFRANAEKTNDSQTS